MSGRGGDGDHSPYMVPYIATKSAITFLDKLELYRVKMKYVFTVENLLKFVQ